MNQQLRDVWATKRSRWSRQQLVFVDECARSEKNGYRKYGWSPKGVSPADLVQTRWSDRYSVLPALTVNGYLPEPLIVQGGVTKEAFIFWLQTNLLPQLQLGFHIVVIDNAAIYHGSGIQQLFEAFEIQLEYLPPYSPDLNPIKLTFNSMKV